MAKLKKIDDKKVLQDIQIAAGMICLGFLKGIQQPQGAAAQQAPGQPPQPQQGQPQGQPQAGPQPQQPPQAPQAGPPGQPQAPQGPQLPPGLQAIAQVLKGANDPAKAIAHVIYMAISKVRFELQKRKIHMDQRIWIMGGGVVDRVIFEIMSAVAMILKFAPAGQAAFVGQVKKDILDLMEDDDNNGKAIKTLHDNGLPLPKPPMGAGQSQGDQSQAGPPQGLAAPQQGAQ